MNPVSLERWSVAAVFHFSFWTLKSLPPTTGSCFKAFISGNESTGITATGWAITCSEEASVPSTLGCAWREAGSWTDWAACVPVLTCMGAIWKQTAQSGKSKDNEENFSALIKKIGDARLSPYYFWFKPHQNAGFSLSPSVSILVNNQIKSIAVGKQSQLWGARTSTSFTLVGGITDPADVQPSEFHQRLLSGQRDYSQWSVIRNLIYGHSIRPLSLRIILMRNSSWRKETRS